MGPPYALWSAAKGAYADSARLMLALTALDTEDRGWSGIDASSADARIVGGGPAYAMTSGGSAPASMGSANTVWLDASTAPSPGVHTFIVTVPEVRVRDAAPVAGNDPWHAVAGPWTFRVDVPVAAGQTFALGASATSGGVSATVVSLSAAPTRVDLDVRWSGRPASDEWSTTGTAVHDGKEMPITGTDAVGGLERLRLATGAASPSGHWKVVIQQTAANPPDGTTVLAGPWTVEFDIP